MGKKSTNDGFDEVDADLLDKLASDLKEVAKGFEASAAALRKESLPPIRLPIASRKRAVETLISLKDRLPGFLNTHRRAHAGEKEGEKRKSEMRKDK